jgi:hypothetical protein
MQFFQIVKMGTRIPYECIMVGFWKYFAGVVRRITPLDQIGDFHYAMYCLFAALSELLICPPEEVDTCAGEVLRYIVQLDIAKHLELGLRYDPTEVEGAIHNNSILRKLQTLSLIGMIHVRHRDPDRVDGTLTCPPGTLQQMKCVLRGIIRILEQKTGLTPRQLAILVQKKHDPQQYAHDRRHNLGLDTLDVIYC